MTIEISIQEHREFTVTAVQSEVLAGNAADLTLRCAGA